MQIHKPAVNTRTAQQGFQGFATELYVKGLTKLAVALGELLSLI